MSNNTETKSIPLINPGSEPMILEMFEQSAERHERAIERLDQLLGILDEEGELPELDMTDMDLVREALNLALRDREDALDAVNGGIEEMKKVIG
jgi:hypothetical protein